MSIEKNKKKIKIMLDYNPIISYIYNIASFEDLSLFKTINLNGTITGKRW